MHELRRQGVDGRGVKTRDFVVEKPPSGDRERLDAYIAQELAREMPELTRSRIRKLIDQGHVLRNGTLPKAGAKVHAGDRLRVTIPPPQAVDLAAEDIPLDVVYQDDDLMVVDKPAGLTVHPAPGHPAHTLVNALLSLCDDLKGIGGEVRPGIVHRLDKDTSGLMAVAKTDRAHRSLTDQFRDRTVVKGYTALVHGAVEPPKGEISAPIGRDTRNRKRMAVVLEGRESLTVYRTLERIEVNGERFSLVEARPKTGRTHQIRVHLAHLGAPLVGDRVYGGAKARWPQASRHLLHAHALGFHHPSHGGWVEFTSDIPADFRAALADLRASAHAKIQTVS